METPIACNSGGATALPGVDIANLEMKIATVILLRWEYHKYNFKLSVGSIMNSAQIRQAFLDCFVKQGHTAATSSSLIPAGDPTLLFTNAGMNQFKDCFLGNEKRSYSRHLNSKMCTSRW